MRESGSSAKVAAPTYLFCPFCTIETSALEISLDGNCAKIRDDANSNERNGLYNELQGREEDKILAGGQRFSAGTFRDFGRVHRQAGTPCLLLASMKCTQQF